MALFLRGALLVMCGIAGLVELKGRSPDLDVVRRMTRIIQHRGPDADGHFIEGPCALGHRRLAIIDLAGGAQPMSIDDGAYTVTFNGEIFNYIELRDELIAKHGRRFASRSDTETLLHAYAVWGDRCVERFNGQWAFAIWDRARRRLFCSRDRIGVRPFFYAEHDGRFAFASEVKSLFSIAGMPRAFDMRGLHEVLTYWCSLAPQTIWRGVNELPPATSLVLEDGVVTLKRYWSLDYDCTPASEDELRALLVDASQLRLRADVPVGAYVSGGLDSAAIAGIVKRHTGTRLSTFSVTFTHPEYDERDYQRDVIAALDTEHATVNADDALIGAVFPDVVWHAETALLRTAPAPLFVLARLVRERGLKVVLTGEGSDEMLGGYDIFKEAKIRRFWSAAPESTLRPLLLRRLYPYMKNVQAQPEAYLRAFFHVRKEDLANPFFSHLPRWRLTQQITGLLSDDARRELKGHDPLGHLRARLPDAFRSWHPFAQAQWLESSILLPGYILSSQGDRVAMAHSIEGRFPFLDVRVMELAARLDPRLKMRGLDEKHLLKRAVRDLVPERVLRRPKQPYRAPDAACFFDARTGAARHPWVDEVLADHAVRDAGLWDATAARKLVEKARRGAAVGTKDSMAIVALISTQILSQRFVRGFGGSFHE